MEISNQNLLCDLNVIDWNLDWRVPACIYERERVSRWKRIYVGSVFLEKSHYQDSVINIEKKKNYNWMLLLFKIKLLVLEKMEWNNKIDQYSESPVSSGTLRILLQGRKRQIFKSNPILVK